jgi:hypothetical protein
VRPTADPDVARPSLSRLQAIAEEMGPLCEIIADYSKLPAPDSTPIKRQDLITLLRRRPCTLDDLCAGLGVTRDQVALQVEALVRTQQILTEVKDGVTFYKTAS